MAGDDPVFTPEPEDYWYNREDKVRRSHDVRIWSDGEIELLTGPDGESASSEKAEGEDEGADKGERAYVDVRRTDIMHVRNGRGMAFMKTFYHFLWLVKGTESPQSREIEFLTIPDPDHESGLTVEVPLIKSLVVTSATNSAVYLALWWPRQLQKFVGKRIVFQNGAHDGRRVIIKRVGNTDKGSEVEVIKSLFAAAGKEQFFQASRFNVPIWGDPDKNKAVYDEGSRRADGGGGGGGEE